MGTQRSTIDGNFMQVEILSNKTDTITSGASSTLYLSEKAAYDYIQNQYYQSTLPVTKDGDTIILSDAAGKAKYKVNDDGVIKDIVFDRACGTYMTLAQLVELNSVYLAGEIITESDTGKQKIGDGVTSYNSLSYKIETLGLTLGDDVVHENEQDLLFKKTLEGCKGVTSFATNNSSTGIITINKTGTYILSAVAAQSQGFSEGTFHFAIYVMGYNSLMYKGFENYLAVSTFNPNRCAMNVGGVMQLKEGDSLRVHVIPPSSSGLYTIEGASTHFTMTMLG